MKELFRHSRADNLLRDSQFCRKWFSASLRREIALAITQADNVVLGSSFYATDGHCLSEGSIGTILDCWNLPTSYRVRELDHALSHSRRSCRSFTLHWDDTTQYPGAARSVDVLLIFEHRRWFIYDIRLGAGLNCSPGTLRHGMFREPGVPRTRPNKGAAGNAMGRLAVCGVKRFGDRAVTPHANRCAGMSRASASGLVSKVLLRSAPPRARA